jgi:hypothetical protein
MTHTMGPRLSCWLAGRCSTHVCGAPGVSACPPKSPACSAQLRNLPYGWRAVPCKNVPARAWHCGAVLSCHNVCGPWWPRYDSMVNDLLADTTVAGQEGVVEYLANAASLQQFNQARLLCAEPSAGWGMSLAASRSLGLGWTLQAVHARALMRKRELTSLAGPWMDVAGSAHARSCASLSIASLASSLAAQGCDVSSLPFDPRPTFGAGGSGIHGAPEAGVPHDS